MLKKNYYKNICDSSPKYLKENVSKTSSNKLFAAFLIYEPPSQSFRIFGWKKEIQSHIINYENRILWENELLWREREKKRKRKSWLRTFLLKSFYVKNEFGGQAHGFKIFHLHQSQEPSVPSKLATFWHFMCYTFHQEFLDIVKKFCRWTHFVDLIFTQFIYKGGPIFSDFGKQVTLG